MLSAYQHTIENLSNLKGMSLLLGNDVKQQFNSLCQAYWLQSLELLDQANTMQRNRLLQQ
jgi:hypothetical protein